MIEKIEIDNSILSKLIKLTLPNTAWNVLLYIIQQNFIEEKEFKMRFILNNTGSSRASINRALKELVNRRIIFYKDKVYTLNVNLAEWDIGRAEPLEFDIDKEETKKDIVEPSKEFFIFFNNYPWRIRYKQTLQVWLEMNPSPELADTIIKAVEKFKTSEQWKKNIGIPAPDTFLINERWRDELTYEKRWDEV